MTSKPQKDLAPAPKIDQIKGVNTTKASAAQIKTLRLRIATYRAELATCTTDAMRRCVLQGIECASSQLLMALRSRES